jgi:chromate transporter
MQTAQKTTQPGRWQLFRLWAAIGLQSFGGGASTSLLIQRTFIDKHKFITIEDYIRYWNLSLFAPGVNLIAMAILIGRRLGGNWGIVCSLIGMLLPSATITCLLTAGFAQIEHLSYVQAIVNGVIPATAGVLLVVGMRNAQPQFKLARQEGWVSILASIFIVVACALALIVFNISVIIVLPAAALLGILFFTCSLKQRKKEQA